MRGVVDALQIARGAGRLVQVQPVLAVGLDLIQAKGVAEPADQRRHLADEPGAEEHQVPGQLRDGARPPVGQLERHFIGGRGGGIDVRHRDDFLTVLLGQTVEIDIAIEVLYERRLDSRIVGPVHLPQQLLARVGPGLEEVVYVGRVVQLIGELRFLVGADADRAHHPRDLGMGQIRLERSEHFRGTLRAPDHRDTVGKFLVQARHERAVLRAVHQVAGGHPGEHGRHVRVAADADHQIPAGDGRSVSEPRLPSRHPAVSVPARLHGATSTVQPQTNL